MSHKTIEVKLMDEVHALVKKMAEHGRGKGRGARVPCTIGEMAGDLIATGVFRRIAANKWAKANGKPSKPRKMTKKPASKKPVKAKKSAAKGKKKGSSKAKPASAAANAAPSILD